jgi:hypothetical protein
VLRDLDHNVADVTAILVDPLRRLCSFRDLPGRLGQVPGGRPLGRHGWRLGL